MDELQGKTDKGCLFATPHPEQGYKNVATRHIYWDVSVFRIIIKTFSRSYRAGVQWRLENEGIPVTPTKAWWSIFVSVYLRQKNKRSDKILVVCH